MAKPAPKSWARFEHEDGSHKPLENSRAGIIKAEHGPRRIDLDSNCTLAVRGVRTIANTHYPLLSRDFVWTKKSEQVAHRLGIHGVVAGKPASARVPKIPWALVATVVSKEGRHPIFSMASQITYAAKRGVDIEHEPKDVPTVGEFLRMVAAAAKSYGEHWTTHYVVKRLVTLPGWESCLAHAKEAGIQTIVIGIGDMDPKTLPEYVDYYRR